MNKKKHSLVPFLVALFLLIVVNIGFAHSEVPLYLPDECLGSGDDIVSDGCLQEFLNQEFPAERVRRTSRGQISGPYSRTADAYENYLYYEEQLYANDAPAAYSQWPICGRDIGWWNTTRYSKPFVCE